MSIMEQSAGAVGSGSGPTGTGLTMRRGRPEDAAALCALAVRSKGWWGYSASFMRECAPELVVSPQAAADTVVAEVDGQLAGFHLLVPMPDGSSDCGELGMLFVDPPFIGSGIGKILFEDARRSAAGRGWLRLIIVADPHSRTFYERAGAVQAGERLSQTIPGHSLPVFDVTLRPRPSASSSPRPTYWR